MARSKSFKSRWLIVGVLAVLITLLLAVIPVYAQIEEPDGVFGVQQIECYRSVQEQNDQLYIILGRIEYTVPPTAYDASQSFIVRLMNGAAER